MAAEERNDDAWSRWIGSAFFAALLLIPLRLLSRFTSFDLSWGLHLGLVVVLTVVFGLASSQKSQKGEKG